MKTLISSIFIFCFTVMLSACVHPTQRPSVNGVVGTVGGAFQNITGKHLK